MSTTMPKDGPVPSLWYQRWFWPLVAAVAIFLLCGTLFGASQKRKADQKKALVSQTVILDDLPRDAPLYVIEEIEQSGGQNRVYILLCGDSGERYGFRQERDAPNLPNGFIVTGQTYNGRLRIIALRDRP